MQGNHIFTSGATGTNAAVIRGALRAENPDLLTVVLPQSLSKQPQESQELLSQVCSIIGQSTARHWGGAFYLFVLVRRPVPGWQQLKFRVPGRQGQVERNFCWQGAWISKELLLLLAGPERHLHAPE